MEDKITTITVDVPIEGGLVDIGTVFYILPVTRHFVDAEGKPIPVEYQKGKDIPVQPLEGVILSARYDQMTRGWRKTTCFKNNIHSDMTVLGKNVNFKISAQKLYITGCNSVFMIKQAGALLLKRIEQAHHELIYMQSRPAETARALEAVRQIVLTSTGTMVMPTMVTIPDDIDSTIMELLLDLANDHESWENYLAVINRLLEAGPVVKYQPGCRQLSLGPILIKMINRIFSLGARVHLLNFALCVLHFDLAMTRYLSTILIQHYPDMAEHSRFLIKGYRETQPHLAFLLDAHAAAQEYLGLSPRLIQGLRNIRVKLNAWQQAYIDKHGSFPQIRLVIDFDNNLDINAKILALHFSNDGRPIHHTFLVHLTGSVTQSSTAKEYVGTIKLFFDEFVKLYGEYIFATAEPLFPIV